MRVLLVLSLLVCWGGAGAALETQSGPVRVDAMATGLNKPWGVGILPDGSFLVTERGGTLRYVRDGRTRKVAGAPQVYAKGQGGLLDITIARDFAQSRELFLTYARRQKNGAGTALAVARLSDDGSRLENLRTIFEAAPGSSSGSSPGSSGGRHFGSRVVEARDGSLFVTLGERGERDKAQDRAYHNGKIVRLNRDGSVPGDNPFVGKAGMRPEIWSWGHRNPQGAALDLQGNLWTSEHGPKGGDEINRIRKGANYGWPVISYGVHYSGRKIGVGTAKPGMEQPGFYWDPSIAPSGLLIYSGKLWPEWRGHFFVGSLKFDLISHLSGRPLRELERIKGPETDRVRDIVEAPDGAIWFISEGGGTVWRMTPG